MRVAFAAVALFFLACGPREEVGASTQNLADEALPDGNRVCSWNMHRLGHKFVQKDKDVVTAAKIIDEHCDLIAVQEVMQVSGGTSPGYVSLLAALGDTWGGELTEHARPDTTSPNSERYAFFFRKTVASPCNGFLTPRFIPDDEDAFLREPAWTCLQIRGQKHELLLMTYHALFGSLADRRREIALLDDDLDGNGQADDILDLVKASRQDANVLIVGDFNLTPPQLAQALPRYKDHTVGSGSTINDNNDVSGNLFDHLVVPVDEPQFDGLKAEPLDVRSEETNDTYFHVVSDHLPIRFVLPNDTALTDAPLPPPSVTDPEPPPSEESPAPTTPDVPSKKKG